MEKVNAKYNVIKKNPGAVLAFLFLLTALVWSAVTSIV